MRTRFACAASAVALVAGLGAADAGTAYREFGDRGRAQDVRRTIDVVMRDNAYEPQRIEVRAGETVRFRVQNRGEFMHEFNLGTPAMHADHRREMQRMVDAGHMTATGLAPADGSPAGGAHGAHGAAGHGGGHGAMAHDDPNSILLEPGKGGELIWKFTRATKLEFACNVPGHYESGMVGQVRFAR